MTMGIEALEAMPLEATREFSVTEPWLGDALSFTTPVNTAADDAATSFLYDAGLHYMRGIQPFLLAPAGRTEEAIAIAEQFIAVLAEAPTPTKGIGSITAFSYMGLGVANAALAQANEARDAFKRALEIFQAMDHHCLVAFMLLTALRDVAMTYAAADPCLRHQMAAVHNSAMRMSALVNRRMDSMANINPDRTTMDTIERLNIETYQNALFVGQISDDLFDRFGQAADQRRNGQDLVTGRELGSFE